MIRRRFTHPRGAKSLMLATFLVLEISVLHYGAVVLALAYAVIFLAGFGVRRKLYFWKLSFLFFSLMSLTYSFTVFGGFEPNTQGAIATGKWFDFGPVLFIMFSVAAMVALVMGLLAEKRHRAGRVGN